MILRRWHITVALVLVLSLLANVTGTALLLHAATSIAKARMKHLIRTSSIAPTRTVLLSADEIVWGSERLRVLKPGKEFILEGKLYDIVSSAPHRGDTLLVRIVHDVVEQGLLQALRAELLSCTAESSGDAKRAKAPTALVSAWKHLLSPAPLGKHITSAVLPVLPSPPAFLHPLKANSHVSSPEPPPPRYNTHQRSN